MATISDKQRRYRKRLIYITPVAIGLVSLLFLSSDVVEKEAIEKRFGWEGPMKLLPEITVIPDDDPFENFNKSRLKTLAAMDVDIIKEIAESEGGESERVENEQPDETQAPELDLLEVPANPMHTEVAYSEDYIITHMVQPEYPPLEQLKGVEADVTVELLINEEGRVENAWVILSLGPKSFEQAALDAVWQFRFKPPTENGAPIPMWIRFQVKFRLVG